MHITLIAEARVDDGVNKVISEGIMMDEERVELARK